MERVTVHIRLFIFIFFCEFRYWTVTEKGARFKIMSREVDKYLILDCEWKFASPSTSKGDLWILIEWN